MVIEVRANRMPDGGIVTTFTDITAERRGRRGAGARQRDARAPRARTHRGTHAAQRRAEHAKGEADAANISKTKFLAAASHDILQPLNAARLYVTSLVERQAAATTPAGRQHRRLARGSRGDFRRPARHVAARHRRDAAGDRRASASTT